MSFSNEKIPWFPFNKSKVAAMSGDTGRNRNQQKMSIDADICLKQVPTPNFASIRIFF